MLSAEEQAAYQEILRQMKEHVSQFITPISENLSNDHGQPAGSGTYVTINGSVYLVTNEHVAEKMKKKGISHLPSPGDHWHRVAEPMQALTYPVDLGVAPIRPESWAMASQSSLPIERFDDEYAPVPGELLFFCGYPGYPRRAIAEFEIRQPYSTNFGYLTIPAVPMITFEVGDPSRTPREFIPDIHSLIHYGGVALRGDDGDVRESPDARGFSGTLVWDTKFIACQGEGWNPSMSRVCGQIHRWNDGHEVLITTKVQHLRDSLLNAVRREAAYFNWISREEPLWDDLTDWEFAERRIPRLSSSSIPEMPE